MNEQAMSFFLDELYRQCDYGVRAHRQMDAVLPDLDDFWFWAQAFLIAAGNASKLLWGVDDKAAKRRRALRDRLEVTADSPLRDRALRNHFEHFDERIEDAVATGAIIDTSVLPPGAIQDPSLLSPLSRTCGSSTPSPGG